MKSLIAGSKVGPCPMHKFITPLAPRKNSSKRSSQLTSSARVSIRLEDGSTLWTSLQLVLKIWIPTKTWSSTGSSWLRMERKCQNDSKTILIQCWFAISLVLMLSDFTWSTLHWWKLTTWTFQSSALRQSSEISSCHGTMLIDSWSRISQSGKASRTPNSNSMKILKNFMTIST